MKRMTREISSILYIFLPYLSFNLGGLLDTLEGHTVGVDGKLEKTGTRDRWPRPALLVPCAPPPPRPSGFL